MPDPRLHPGFCLRRNARIEYKYQLCLNGTKGVEKSLHTLKQLVPSTYDNNNNNDASRAVSQPGRQHLWAVVHKIRRGLWSVGLVWVQATAQSRILPEPGGGLGGLGGGVCVLKIDLQFRWWQWRAKHPLQPGSASTSRPHHRIPARMAPRRTPPLRLQRCHAAHGRRMSTHIPKQLIHQRDSKCCGCKPGTCYPLHTNARTKAGVGENLRSASQRRC